jgi:hypothetical protein
MGLSFTIAAGPRQRSLSRVRVPRDSWLYFTLSDWWLTQPGAHGPRIYITQEQGPGYTPKLWVPFSSPPTTRRATVDLFEHASSLQVEVKVEVTLRLAIYHQSVRLGVKPLETHDHRFFQLNSHGKSPYVTSSLTRRWIYLSWICLAFHQVFISHTYHVTENSSFLHYIQFLCQYRLHRADHAYLTYLMLQRQASQNGLKLDHRQV